MNKNSLKSSAFSFQPKSGITLIEIILYIALVAIFLTGAVLFTWDIVYGREKAFQQQIVDQSARIAMERIAYEIRRAEDIVSVAGTQIVLDNGASTTTISLSANTIQITSEGLEPYDLTSNQARVTGLTFTDLSASVGDATGQDSKNISVSMTIEQAQVGVSGQLTVITTLEESVELNSQFNQSRRLLVDLSVANFSAVTAISGITIQNSGSDDIVIDKLNLSWQGTAGGENLTEAQIGAGGVEWSGTSGTGGEVDLVDFTLATSDGVVDFDYLEFDSDMSGIQLNLDFILSDASVLNSYLFLENVGEPTATPTPTPTPTSTPVPTSTPTPPPTCSSYCVSLGGYVSGICRQHAGACSSNGETSESGGDVYCTGGPAADTCCCQ